MQQFVVTEKMKDNDRQKGRVVESESSSSDSEDVDMENVSSDKPSSLKSKSRKSSSALEEEHKSTSKDKVESISEGPPVKVVAEEEEEESSNKGSSNNQKSDEPEPQLKKLASSDRSSFSDQNEEVKFAKKSDKSLSVVEDVEMEPKNKRRTGSKKKSAKKPVKGNTR